VLIGGTAFGGGVGTLFGTALGVAFLGVLGSGLLISGISSYWQGVITGVVLIAAVTADRIRAHRSPERAARGPRSRPRRGRPTPEVVGQIGSSRGDEVVASTNGPSAGALIQHVSEKQEETR
jgi:hypothetical protein